MGLIGWWPLHESSGRANDLSGNGNHGTLGDGSTLSTYPTQGVYGLGGLTAYSFDGSDDYIDLGNLSSSSSISFSVWFRYSSSDSDFIAAGGWDGTTAEWKLKIESDSSITWSPYDSNDNYTGIRSAGSTSTDTWHHLVGVYNGNTEEYLLYLDSSLIATVSSSVGPIDTKNSESWAIGCEIQQGTPSNHWNGSIVDFRAYDRALSPQEVQELYEMGSGDYTRKSLHDGLDGGAVSRYKFESGSVTVDSWGSNTLTDSTSAGTTSDCVYGSTAKSFDGSDDEMNIGSTASDLGVNDAGTFSVWLNVDDTTGDGTTNKRFVSDRNGASSNYLQMYYTDGEASNPWKVAIDIEDGTSLRRVETSNYVVDPKCWQHIVGTWNSTGRFRIYLNGAVSVSSDTSFDGNWSPSNSLKLASNGGFSGQRMSGVMDDVRIYNRALSASEVAQLYRQKHGRDMRKLTTQK